MKEDYIKSSIMGFVVGDALGVPVEFSSKKQMQEHPLTDMEEYGTHNQPIGTWSDDSSMTLATIDSINEKGKIDYNDIMKKYSEWKRTAKYTATDKLFDIGITTSNAIGRYNRGEMNPTECGDYGLNNNGNGSLMRSLPIAIYLANSNLSENEKTKIVNEYSSMTHAHEISRLGCKIYCDFIEGLIKNNFDKVKALDTIKNKNYKKFYSNETINLYRRVLDGTICNEREENIKGSGYVLHTLEASVWAIMTTDNYSDAVLKSINLGEDTDTVGAITGSLAGMIYGYSNIPNKWLNNIKKRDEVEKISDTFSNMIEKNNLNELNAMFEEPKKKWSFFKHFK